MTPRRPEDSDDQDEAGRLYWRSLTSATGPDGERSAEQDRLLHLAAERGSADAQQSLGAFYATGDWTGPKDLTAAVRWYRLAAAQGNAAAQFDLGWMRLAGEGEPADIAEGVRWLEEADRNGHRDAADFLAGCYADGSYGIPRDAGRAARWAERAAQVRARLDTRA